MNDKLKGILTEEDAEEILRTAWPEIMKECVESGIEYLKLEGIIRRTADEELWEYMDKTIPKDNLRLHHELQEKILSAKSEWEAKAIKNYITKTSLRW